MARLGTIAVSKRVRRRPRIEYAGGFAREADASAGRLYRLARRVVLAASRRRSRCNDAAWKSAEVAMTALERGVRPVVGASGWSENPNANALGALATQRLLGAIIVPNFSLGAIVAMRLAAASLALLPECGELVEMHRVQKKANPSGTALETAAARWLPPAPTSPPFIACDCLG